MGFLDYLNKAEEKSTKKQEEKKIVENKVIKEEKTQEKKQSIEEHVNVILDGVVYTPEKGMKLSDGDSVDHINSILS